MAIFAANAAYAESKANPDQAPTPVSTAPVSPSAASSGAKLPEQFQVSGVQIEGNQRIDRAAVRAQLKHVAGAVSSAQVSEDVKTIYETGFFDQVTASLIRKDNAPVLRYQLVEKPVVRKVFIRGNESIDQDELSKLFAFDSRRFLDRGKVDSLIKQAVGLYQNRGFYDAAFEYAVVPVGENQVDITFTVTEGKRYKIRRISFAGVNILDPDDLSGTIQTKKYKWWNSWLLGTGRLNVDMLDNDRLIIRQFFLDRGLLDATVSEPQIERKEDGLYVSFDVREGSEYKIAAITAAGDLVEGSPEKTVSDLKTSVGDTFNASAIREDSFKISERFGDRGYAFANVVPDTQIDHDAHSVNLTFNSNKGKLAAINHINIKGNDKTFDNVIRRELKIDEQDTFNGSKIKRSQELLQRLGYFEEVSITQDPVGEDKVDLNVNVREGSTGTFSAGAGYSNADGPLFNTRLSENNLFGTGRRAVINLDFGTRRDSQIFSLDDRRLLDSYVSGGFDLLRTAREYTDFDRNLTGGSITLGYPLEQIFDGEWAQDLSVSSKYEYLDINIKNVDADAAELVRLSRGRSTASAVTPRISRNTINNPLNPTNGSRQSLSVELAGLGGDEKFYLFEAEQSLFYPFYKSSYGDLVFSWRTTFGYGETFNDDIFPLYRRYFPGGINTVRGYKERTLGPRDSAGKEFGGSKELVNNWEMIFPIFNSAGIRGVVFYDAGQAFDDDESLDIGKLRQAYGFGIRWASPLGPLRIEFGIPIARRSGEDSLQTQFSFGSPL